MRSTFDDALPTAVQTAVRAALGDGGAGRVLLAVSGGIDSMVLLHAMREVLAAEQIVVATFDHGTGAAAATAAGLVAERAARFGVACVAERARVALRSENDLRGARWEFLRRAAREHDARIATAHTRDDQVETVLMRIMRGAGARGLAGLYADTDVARPFVHVRRMQIASYAAARGVTWIEDPTNTSRQFLRNRVRHELLPALAGVRPSIEEELLASATAAAAWRRDVDRYVDAWVDLTPRMNVGLDVPAAPLAAASVSALGVLWPAIAARAGAILDRRGIARLVRFTRGARVGGAMPLSGGWTVCRSRDTFQLRWSDSARRGSPSPKPHALAVGAATVWGAWWFGPGDGTRENGTRENGWSAWLPTDRPLVIRRWRPGDAMDVGGKSGRRKVKYFLSDAGVTGHDRAGWPVVEAGGEIVWIPGVRRSDAATARSGRPRVAFSCECRDHGNR